MTKEPNVLPVAQGSDPGVDLLAPPVFSLSFPAAEETEENTACAPDPVTSYAEALRVLVATWLLPT